MESDGAADANEALRIARDLRQVTERMLEAAKSLDSPTLAQLVEMRGDRLFELRIALESTPLDDTIKASISEEFQALRQIEHRLERISSLVLQALSPLFPAQPVATYGRAGRMSSGANLAAKPKGR